MNLNVQNLSKSLPLPKYETEGSAGMDVRACFDCGASVTIVDKKSQELEQVQINENTTIELFPGARILIPTGLKVEIPIGYEIQVRPRSGLAIKKGITVLNTPGTIDSDYRGMVGIILINHSATIFRIKHGDKIAQIVLNKVEQIKWNQISELTETLRGEGGFGSTTK